MANDFKTGDIVQLKSGGPKMVVAKSTTEKTLEIPEIELDPRGSVRCQWFSGSKLQEGWFDPESLVKVEEGEER